MVHPLRSAVIGDGTDVTSVLLGLVETVAGHTHLDTLLPQVVNFTTQALGCARCLLYLWDDDNARFEPAAACGLTPRLERLFHRLSVAPGDVPLVDRAVRLQRPVVADPASAGLSRAIWQRLGARAVLVAPLLYHERVIGGLIAVSDTQNLGRPETALINGIARQTALAVVSARATEAERRRRRQLEGLQKTIAALSAELQRDPLLQLIAAETASIFDASAVAVLMWDRARENLIVQAHHGLPSYFARQLCLPYRDIRSGLNHSPDADLITMHDLSAGCLDSENETVETELADVLGAAPELCSALLCALQMGGQLIGALVVYDAKPRRFRPDEKALARTLAQQAAIAIENSQLYSALEAERERLRALSVQLTQAQEAERTRLARELHDEAGQSLTAVGLQLEFIDSLLPPDALLAVREQIREAQALVRHTVEEIRRISIDLRPSLLDDLGLTPALRWQCDRFSRHTKLKVVFESSGETRRLDADVETALYRAAQEALTNTVRHAQASEAFIAVDYRETRLRMTIADNGRGFQPADGSIGVGLLGMEERIAAVGGSVDLDSPPGSGSILTIEVPLKRGEAET